MLRSPGLRLILYVILVIALGSVCIRLRSSTYACLAYYSDYTRQTILDLNTGRVLEGINKGPRQDGPDPQLSPDGRWHVWVGGSSPGMYNLSVENVRTGTYISLQGTIATWFPMDLDSAWSPDGKKLAFIWQDNQSQHFLETFEPDSGSKQTVLLEGSNRSLQTTTGGLQGWSSDGLYLAVSVQGSIQFFTGDSLRLMATAPTQPFSWIGVLLALMIH